jgi:hypothetical protein
MTKIGWLVVFMFLVISQLTAQTIKNIKVNARKTPLSQILLDLKETYGLQFAFDNDLLSKYKVSVNRTFQTENEALAYLVKNLPLEVERSGEVFLIIPTSFDNKKQVGSIKISGQVLEAQTYEPLPFSYILINRKSVQADQQGHFNFLASADTSFNLQISHLGYFIYDTIVTHSLQKQFFLMPQIERIKEVKVLSNPIEKSTLIGNTAGHMKINHQIAPVLPGYGDNSVFNLLRLMPGILAAGEQSNDLLIWGAYESHSKIQFDGFTVFGLKNFNDNISVVNPLVVKNIEVMKGGYEARYGGRVGGIVDIAGKDGTLVKPTFTFTINSTTLNSMLQVPLSKKSSLMAAYRQTYYKLYDPSTLNLFGQNNTENGNEYSDGVEFEIIPDFMFRDGNLKYSYKGDNGSRFSMSLYGGGDEFLYMMEGELGKNEIIRTEEEENKQLGGSLQYNYPWKNGNTTNFTMGYSFFVQQSFEQNKIENIRTGFSRITKEINSENDVNELTLNAEHSLNFKGGHKLIIGAGAIQNQVSLSRISKEEAVIDINSKSPRFVSYVQDELPVGEVLKLKTGLRMIYASELERFYFEPRISASLKIIDGMKLNASWGLYNQFLSKTSVVDSSLNYAYFWINADKNSIPVLNAGHFVAGISFNKNGFTFSTEGYYKTTTGLNRYSRGNRIIEDGFYAGNAKSYGLDFFLKKEYKRHMAWISYTLSQTEEHFPFYIKDYYKPAPHNQTHELKFAGVLNYKSFYFSGNYIYGSGFERFNIETKDGIQLNQPYNRLDAALVYKFNPGKVRAEAGISILNVLNKDNIKYSNLKVTSVDDISLVGMYADAIPFTPALFLKIEL